jgi:ubiquinone/menaquinone biosynthesis C-methylase UbiE
MIQTGNQYRDDIFNKLSFNFEKGRKLLDVGCGEGHDLKVFRDYYGLEVYGVDVYKNKSPDLRGVNFKIGNIYDIPYKNDFFDYVFLHDVLHHIDEPQQRHTKHVEGLKEVRRVCKKGGTVIIVEANRYNPISYIHMVLLCGHAHLSRGYFKKLIWAVFDSVEFRSSEVHLYPHKCLKTFKVYEKVIENFSFLKPFRAYNIAIIKNDA